MSSNSGNLLTTSVFNPALLRKEDLVRGFVARQDLLERLLDDLRRVQRESPPQHHLLIGQRGLGKTTVLRRLAFAIEDDPALSAEWVGLAFPEEQYNVKNLGDFWLNCADALSDALDRMGKVAAAENLDARVEQMPLDPSRRSEAALRVLLDAADQLGRGLVLLVDNLDIVLDRLNRDEEWEFRRVISTEHRLYFIGASSRVLEAFYEHGRAFYDYFQVHDLKGLDDDETFALLKRLADEARDERVQKLLREKPARVRALRVLTGGNPRTLVLLYRVLAEGPDGDVQRDVEQLLDLYTPLYKSRFEEMAPQAQQLVDAMAIHWDPITAGDLTEKLASLSVNQVSAQLTRLEDFGIVEKAPWFGEKKTAFQIAERFFNIWYLMRASRRVRRRLVWLVKFLEAWFERDELTEQARGYLTRDPESVGREQYAEMALAYSQAVEDRYLRRSLESEGLRAALDVSVRDLIDFSDLPQELQDRKQRMERLRELRHRVLAMHLEEVEPEELWRVLGGSPHLSLEEKARVVDELPTLEAGGAGKLYEKLKRAEEQLRRVYSRETADVTRLYEALATGEMEDVYDLAGALSIADRWGSRNLLRVAIFSRCNPHCSPEPLSEMELNRSENALRALASEPGYEATGWSGLGILFEERLKRYSEAELAYRRALEIDPQSGFTWYGLVSVLWNLKRYDEAAQVLRRAIEIDPQSASGWYWCGNLLRILKQYAEAEQAYRRAVELDPQNASAWFELGNMLRNQNQFDAAEQALRRAVELDEQSINAWYGLGLMLWSIKRYDEAAHAFRHALELDPQNIYGWIGLGSVLRDLRQYHEAEQAYRRALEIDPQSADAWFSLGLVLVFQSDRHYEALGAIIHWMELDTNEVWVDIVLQLARSMGSGPHRMAALSAMTRMQELRPSKPEIQFVRAGLLALNGFWEEAQMLLETLVAGETEKPDLWTFHAVVQTGHTAEVISLLEKTGVDQRWRPLYEALRAVQAGTADYLRRVAPEVRTVAREILNEIAPELVPKNPPQPKRAKAV